MSTLEIIVAGVLTTIAYIHGCYVGYKNGIEKGKEEAFKRIFNDFNEWKSKHVDYKCEKGEKIKVTPRVSKNEKGSTEVIGVNFEYDY